MFKNIKRKFQEKRFIVYILNYLKNQVIRFFKYNNLFYLFNSKRKITKQYQRKIPGLNKFQFKVGNYYLDNRVPLSPNSKIYSLGILEDISFDKALSKMYKCKIFMYDPSPVSLKFMKKHEYNKLFEFFPYGVWTENITLKFYEPPLGGSPSAVFQSGKTFFESPCYTVEQLMERNNHTNIDVFKADIEGAALPILYQMIKKNILPTQIVAEFECPKKGVKELNQFLKDLTGLRNSLQNRGYDEFILPRNKAKYFSIEMLFVQLKSN